MYLKKGVFKKISIVGIIFSLFEGVRAGNTQTENFSINSLILREMELDPTVHFVPTILDASPPRPFDIAYNPNKREFLIVWSQENDYENIKRDIYGAFVDEETGKISKPFPIVILPKDQIQPCVSFDGHNYLVVWVYRNLDENIFEIHGTLIDQNGNILIQNIIIRPQTSERKNFLNPSVAFNGEHYLVVWSGEYTIPFLPSSTRRIIAGRVIDRNGNVIGNEDIFISPFDPTGNHHCNVTSDGINFLVTWTVNQVLQARLVDRNGVPGPDIISLSTTVADSTRIAKSVYGEYENQKKYLVVWTDVRNGIGDIYAALIEPNLSSSQIYPVDTAPENQVFPSCTFVPLYGHFLIIWEDKIPGNTHIVGRIIDFFGVIGPRQPVSYISTPLFLGPTEIKFGTECAFAGWVRYYNVSGVRVDGMLNRIDPQELLINYSLNSQQVVKSAFDGKKYFAVWEDNKRGSESMYGAYEKGIYLTRITPEGKILDIPPICIRDELNLGELYPDIAFASQNFLITYTTPDISGSIRIEGTIVDQECNIIQHINIDLTPPATFRIPPPSLDASQTHFLCAYRTPHPLYLDRHLVKTAIIEQQNPSNIQHYIVEEILDGFGVDFPPVNIASNEDRFMIVYEVRNAPITYMKSAVVGPDFPPTPPIAIGEGKEPTIIFGNNYYFVVWIDLTETKIMGRFVDRDGNPVGDPFIIYDSPNPVERPSVEFDGWEYLVSFTDLGDGKIKVVAVGLDGSVLGEVPWIISGEHPSQGNASLQKGLGNQILATYEGLIEDPFRAFARFLEFFEVEEFATAYNSNVNMQREPLTDKIHLVFTSFGKAYYREGFILKRPILIGPERILWNEVFELGSAQPGNAAIVWDGDVHVTWSTGAQIYYRRKTGEQWTPPYSFPPHIGMNILPTIASSRTPVTPGYIHIIYNNVKPFPLGTNLYEIYFPRGNPSQYTEIPIYGFFPSAQQIISSVDFLQNLHLAFTWNDEIYYATRKIHEPYWTIHGNVFPNNLGKNSTTPMTEVYGDSIFIVWTKYWGGNNYEVIRASKHIEDSIDRWNAGNFSRTPFSPPCDPRIYQAPVNAWGIFTVWVDSGVSGNCDVFTRDPTDNNILVNLTHSQVHSHFPEAFAKFQIPYTIFGLAWLEQENQSSLYDLRSQIFRFLPIIPAYYTLTAGDITPSIHLTHRDSFIREWKYPVDIDYDSISAKFYSDPLFEYDIEITVYQEKQNEWREFVYFDGKPHRLIKYNPYELKTVKIHVPKGFYKDGILNVSLKRIKGNYATLHKIIVYRYEGEEEIVAQISKNELEKEALTQSFRVYPTLVKNKISIEFEMPIAKQNSISIYDIMGRKIESIMIPKNTKTFIINLEKIPKGIYFVKLENENKIYRIVKIK